MTTTEPLGNFSISLAVKDLDASRAFYEKVGFEVIGGQAAHHYLILRCGTTTIGLFQGAIERNALTFNPGWDASCNELPEYADVRELQRRFRERGLEPSVAADETTSGPAHFVLVDPDGNPLLFDQHV